METKSAVILEVKKGDHIFRLELPLNAPLGDAYEAVWAMLAKIADLAKESVDKAKKESAGDD